jgi:hypothetical protein
MSARSFLLLYLLCLGFSLGAVEALQLTWQASLPPPPPAAKVDEVIAVPPRPEGVRKVVGEGDVADRYTEAGCNKLAGQYRDICFHQLARQQAPTDIDGGLQTCLKLASRASQHECEADVAELYAPTDRDRSLQVCPTIESKKWADQCVFGIALALTPIDPEYAFRTCDGSGQWRQFCRHDVNGEIAVVDLELALSHCAAEEGELLQRKTCWHGIGKYIARVDVDRAFAACDRVPMGPDGLYRENCFHGLGWGASEGAGLPFAARCSQAGEQRDSCLLGVAYNLVRFDKDAAAGLCAQVGRTDLRGQCERFVQRGSLN